MLAVAVAACGDSGSGGVSIRNDVDYAVVVTGPGAGRTLGPGERLSVPVEEGGCTSGTYTFATTDGAVIATRAGLCADNPVTVGGLLRQRCLVDPAAPGCAKP